MRQARSRAKQVCLNLHTTPNHVIHLLLSITASPTPEISDIFLSCPMFLVRFLFLPSPIPSRLIRAQQTALHWACGPVLGPARGNKVSSAAIKALLAAGMDHEVAQIGDDGGYSALHYLAIQDDNDREAILAIKMLHKKMPELFSGGNGNTNGWTPIHCAVMHGRPGMAQLLATLGGRSALMSRILPVSRFPGYSCLHLIALTGDTAGKPMLHDPESDFCSIQVVGLEKAQIYNGRECWVVKRLTNGRYQVVLRGDKKELSLRGENLMRVEEVRRLDAAVSMARSLCCIGGRELMLLPNARGDTPVEVAEKEGNSIIADLFRDMLLKLRDADAMSDPAEHPEIVFAAQGNPVLGCLMRVYNLDPAHNNRKVRILARQGDGSFLVVDDARASRNTQQMISPLVNATARQLSPSSTPVAVEAFNLAPMQVLLFDGPPGFRYTLKSIRQEYLCKFFSPRVPEGISSIRESAHQAVALFARHFGLEEKNVVLVEAPDSGDKIVAEVILEGGVVVPKRVPSHIFQH